MITDDVARALEFAERQQAALAADDGGIAAERERLKDPREFLRAAWTLLEPRRTLIWGWHIDAILEHLAAVHREEIQTLIINIPPAHMKSTTVNVAFPAWRWGGGGMPEARMLAGSYALSLAKTFTEKSRRLVKSEWFRSLWPEVVINRSADSVMEFENLLGGGRYTFSTDGTITGKHCDMCLLDDPLKASDGQSSPRKRQKVIEFWTETIPSRLIDPVRSARVLMMQRLHEKDLSGFALADAEEDDDVVHLCLPCHFDPQRACKTRWFIDPRKVEGELLWPERFDEKRIRKLARGMSERAKAAQLEQLPWVPGGQYIRRKDWLIWPQAKYPVLRRLGIFFDAAMTDGDDTSYWACIVVGVFSPAESWDLEEMPAPKGLPDHNCLCLLKAWRVRGRYPQVKRLLLDEIGHWEERTEVDEVVIERKANGITLLDEFEEAGMPNVVPFDPETKSKVERAEIASDFHQAGRWWILGRMSRDTGTRSGQHWSKWAEEVVHECEMFPTGETNDYVDTVTMATLYYRKERLISAATDYDEPEEPHDDFAQRRGPVYA